MIKENIEKLKSDDVYSLILFALYKLKDIPEYRTLSEVSYILDKKNLIDFLGYFGGMTIKVPTLPEFRLIVNALLLYEFVNLENIEFNKALQMIDVEDYKIKDVKDAYYSICSVLDNYEFKR